MKRDGIRFGARVEINAVQLRPLPTRAQSARGGRTFPRRLKPCVAGHAGRSLLQTHPDFNKDSLRFSSALKKCTLFHRAPLHSNTTECKMNTAMRRRTNSLCFLERHNLPASCGSGSTWTALHLNSRSVENNAS